MPKEKYDAIGIDYNQSRKADPYLTSRLIHHLELQKGKLYLDIGCGTGNYTHAVAQQNYDFIGVDPSILMLEKAKKLNQNIQWLEGKAEDIPLANESIDTAMASLTLHHWRSLDLGFKSLNRVLKPDGKLVIFTATPQQMEGYWLNHYFPKMLKDSMVQMPDFSLIQQALNDNQFSIIETEKYNIHDDLEDLFLYAGKNRPHLYLDKKVRWGISSFSSLSNAEEVQQGLLQLKSDINSGHINTIIKNYQNDDGDYLYIIAKKMRR